MKPNSLAFRLIATLASWTLIVLPLAGFLIYRLYRSDVQGAFEGEMEKLVNSIALDAMSSDGAVPSEPGNSYQPLFEVPQSGWYWQVQPVDDPNAKRLVSASLGTSDIASPFKAGVSPDPSGARWSIGKGPGGEPIRIVEIVDTLNHIAAAPRYSIIVAGPWDWLTSKLKRFSARLSAALALTGLGLVSVAFFQVRFGLLPLRRIEQDVAAIRSGEAARLEGELPVEIEPLKVELNALIQSNQEIVERARTQVGNLAHALKTPLAVIVNEAREERTPFGDKVAGQAEIMRDQIKIYLDRASVAARAGVIGRATDVAAVVEPLVRALERINRDKDLAIRASCQPGLKFQGERQDFEEILGNILDNACKWARHEVVLDVSASAPGSRAVGRCLLIRVEDDGPGLTSEQRSRIGKRGLRLDETKPGSGLGLSIVIELVQMYRGRVELGEARGGGLMVAIDLPAV
jgi:signal transduction histidine kinase